MSVKKIGVGATAGAALGALAMSLAVPNIEKWEGTKAAAYRDIIGVLTICTGHTGPDVVVGQVKSKDECSKLTAQDAEKAAAGVLKVSPHLLFHPMQLAAAISFSFNVGVGTYSNSSVARDFNAGKFVDACNDLSKYTFAGGQYSQGLVNRRVDERALCLSTLTIEGYKNVTVTTSLTP